MRPISVGVSPAATVQTLVYTVPTGYYAKMNLMFSHNTTGSNKHMTVTWYDASSATSLDILNQYTISAKTYVQFDGGAYIVLEEGDNIKITSESGSTFTFIATFEETGLTRQ